MLTCIAGTLNMASSNTALYDIVQNSSHMIVYAEALQSQPSTVLYGPYLPYTEVDAPIV